jgi:serine/threonine protein kinase
MNQGRDGDPPFTSEDLFGDLVDSKAGAPKKPPQAKAPPRVHTGPIKVKVSEPGATRKKEALPEELSALLDAFDAGPPSMLETPTPAAVEPLPDLPEYKETQRLTAEAEARGELLQLTSRLRQDPGSGDDHGFDLASVAEDAIVAATPASKPSVGAVIPLPAEPAGTGYGPYQLVAKVATGGMAEVFKAKRAGVAGFEKVVAVKRILPHLSYNKEFVEMFIDEAKMVAGLQHPNIVQIFDLGRIGSSYYIAMEYVHGADLRSILRRLKERSLRMPTDLAVYVVSKVAAGLDYAHQNKDGEGRPTKIVHRDVSPQNILISFDGEVKLTDFGIAKAATKASTTEKGALRGKLMYMSPEQAWGKPIDHRSDVFALGIVLYELITDQRPFLGSSDMSLLDKVRKGSVTPPSSLHPETPARLEKLVMKALEKEPLDRQRDAGAMHLELEALLQEPEQPVSARDLARFVRILFEKSERGDTGSATTETVMASCPELDVDLHALDAPLPDEPLRIISDAMPLERLLKRFGPG